MSKPSKGKEIELKPCPFCGEIEDLEYVGLFIRCKNLDCFSTGPLVEIEGLEDPEKELEGAVFEAWNTRQSPQINIDELTGVIESEITRFVPNAKDKFADVLAKAITSHLNGKGDGDE